MSLYSNILPSTNLFFGAYDEIMIYDGIIINTNYGKYYGLS